MINVRSNKTKTQEMKKELPYGKYIFTDGSQILFNRKYELIAHQETVDTRSLELKIAAAKKQWFYDDSNPPWENQETLRKCQSVLKAFNVK